MTVRETQAHLALRNVIAKRRRSNSAWKATIPYLSMLFGTRFTYRG